MQRDGVEIPPLPVIYVTAKNEKDAKDLLLRINSSYGKMTKQSVLDFIGQDIELDLHEFELPAYNISFDNPFNFELPKSPSEKNNDNEEEKNIPSNYIPDPVFEYDLSKDDVIDFIKTDEEKIIHQEEELPEINEEKIVSKRGEVYKLGNSFLMCGDATSKEDIEKLMRGNKADMVFTDPPYGMNLNTDYSSMKNKPEFAKEKNFTGGKKYAQGFVDEFKPELIKTVFDNFGYCKEIFLWGADYFAELLENKNDGSWVVWDKRENNEQFDKMFGSMFELCWSKAKHKREIARIRWCGVFGTEQEFDKKRHHPTQKPIKLVEWFLNKYSKEHDKIVDLYGGSGSLLIAGEQMNRQCFVMEIDEKYCDVIRKRYAKWAEKNGKPIDDGLKN